MSETIDQLLPRLCREHDLTKLDVQFRKDGNDEYYGSTAIWGPNSDNCWGTGKTAALAISDALTRAKAMRSPIAVSDVIGAPDMLVAA